MALVWTGRSSLPQSIASWAWLAPAFAGLFMCWRGAGTHSLWLALGLAPLGFRWLMSASFRGAVHEWASDLRRRLADYPHRDPVLPWRSVTCLVVCPFAFLFLINGRTQMGDNSPVFMAAGSFVREGNVELSEYDDPKALNRCLVRRPDGLYSAYPAGPLQLAAPVAALARLLGADVLEHRVQERLQKWSAAWLSAACLGLFCLIALHLAPLSAAGMMTVLLGTGSVMFTTVGQGLWQHGGIILGSLVVLLVEFDSRGRPDRRGVVLQGLALGLMIPWRPSALLVALILGLWLLVRAPRRAIVMVAIATLAAAPWLTWYSLRYGHWLGPTHLQSDSHSWSWDRLDGLVGVLVSPGRGLLVYQVWLVLLAGSLVMAVRGVGKAGPSGWRWCCVAALVMNVLMVGAWSCWWGGCCYGSRLNAEVVPLAALLCVGPLHWLMARGPGRALVLLLLAMGWWTHGAAAFGEAQHWYTAREDHDPARLWSWRDAPFLSPLQRYGS